MQQDRNVYSSVSPLLIESVLLLAGKKYPAQYDEFIS